MKSNAHSLVGLIFLAASGGCTADGGGPSHTFTVRDSAGVRIVENHLGGVTEWQLSPTPLLSIGSATDSLALLHEVEGAHRLSDGRVVVANRGTNELRYYSTDGVFLHSAGRKGQGPGEYEYIAWTASCGADSIFAYDIVTRRLSVFDETGKFARSVMLQLPGGVVPYGAATCAEDGTFLIAGWGATPRDAGPFRVSRPLALIGSDGTAIESLGEFPGGERYGYVTNGRLTESGPRPLGRETSHVLGDQRFYLGTAHTYEIRAYSHAGELEMLIRRDVQDLAITESHIRRFVSDRISRAPDANVRRARERHYRDMEFPATFPAYSRLLLDDLGDLWVQDYLPPGDDQPVWRVFGHDGVHIAVANTPPGLHVYEIGADYMLGKWQDEFDVEHVRIYELVKP